MESVQSEQAAGQAGWALGVALVAVAVGLLFQKVFSLSRKVVTPPGGRGWPLIGETLDYLAAKRANAAPQFFTTRVAKYGEVGRSYTLTSY